MILISKHVWIHSVHIERATSHHRYHHHHHHNHGWWSTMADVKKMLVVCFTKKYATIEFAMLAKINSTQYVCHRRRITDICDVKTWVIRFPVFFRLLVVHNRPLIRIRLLRWHKFNGVTKIFAITLNATTWLYIRHRRGIVMRSFFSFFSFLLAVCYASCGHTQLAPIDFA